MSHPPKILPVPHDTARRPFWTVAIPTYNPPAHHFEKALRSVLEQAPSPEQMEIIVVDDASPDGSPEQLAKRIGGERIRFFRNEKNLRLPGIWNDCIARSRGEWVHILHQDDFVLPGFYRRLEEAAKSHPNAHLLASRSFFVDGDGIILKAMDRVRSLEQGGNSVGDFFYDTPLQCAAVAVKRSFYEKHGAFLPELVFTVDREMWTRAVSIGGGVVIPDVLACYRLANGTETTRLNQMGEDLRDMERLHRIFASRHPEFDSRKAMEQACHIALQQALRFQENGNHEAARANLEFWRKYAPLGRRLRKFAGRIARKLMN